MLLCCYRCSLVARPPVLFFQHHDISGHATRAKDTHTASSLQVTIRPSEQNGAGLQIAHRRRCDRELFALKRVMKPAVLLSKL